MHFSVVVLLLAQVMMTTPPSDRTIYAELKKPLSSDHSHVGERVELEVLEDWRDKDGHVLIPAKAKLTGKVVAAFKHRGKQPGSLSFVVEDGEWRGGSRPLHASVQSVVVMGVKRVSTDLPLRRGVDGQDMGVSGSYQTSLDPVPKDCSVQSSTDPSGENAVVCSKRDVHFKEGGQVLLVDHAVPKS